MINITPKSFGGDNLNLVTAGCMGDRIIFIFNL